MWQLAAGVAGAQTALSLYQGYEAKRAARKQARSQAAAYWEQAQEELYRLKDQQQQNLAMIETGTAFSGLAMTGTAQVYFDSVASEQSRQYVMQRNIAQKNRQAIIQGGQAQGDALFRSSVIQGASQAIGTGYNYYMSTV